MTLMVHTDTTLSRSAGMGARPRHFEEWKRDTSLEWVEIMTDNLMHQRGGAVLANHQEITKNRKVLLHGVGLNILGEQPISQKYLIQLRELIAVFSPVVVSDHLCLTGTRSIKTFDLLPPVYCDEMLEHGARRIAMVQEFLGRNIALENVSSYVRYCDSTMDEGEFFARLVRMTGCQVLLDLNNLEVNEINHGWSGQKFINELPQDCVAQYHLSGHERRGDIAIDTHGQRISNVTWLLYDNALDRFGSHPTILERDDENANFDECSAELLTGLSRSRQPFKAPGPQRDHQFNLNSGNISQAFVKESGYASTAINQSTVFVESVWKGYSGEYDTAAQAKLGGILAPRTAPYIGVYQEALSIRLGEVLAKSILEPCSKVFGIEAVIGMLQRFFKACPPSCQLLQDTLHELPGYLDSLPLSDKGTLLRDLCRASVTAWHVLTDQDFLTPANLESDDIHSAYIAPDARLSTSDFNLYGLWLVSQQKKDYEPVILHTWLNTEESSSILFFKQQSQKLCTQWVPAELTKVAHQLIAGHSLSTSIEHGLSSDSTLPTEVFQKWLANLNDAGGLSSAFSRGLTRD